MNEQVYPSVSYKLFTLALVLTGSSTITLPLANNAISRA